MVQLNVAKPADLAKLLQIKAGEIGALRKIIDKRMSAAGSDELTPSENAKVLFACLDALAWNMHTLSLVMQSAGGQPRVVPVAAMPNLRRVN